MSRTSLPGESPMPDPSLRPTTDPADQPVRSDQPNPSDAPDRPTQPRTPAVSNASLKQRLAGGWNVPDATSRRAPISHEASSVPIVERRHQSYRHAETTRLRSTATFGTDNLAKWDRLLAKGLITGPISQLNAQAYMQWLMVLAHFGHRVLSGRFDPATAPMPTPEDLYRKATAEELDNFRRSILTTVAHTRQEAKKILNKKARRGEPAGSPLHQKEQARAVLESTALDFLHIPDLPWDAFQDGHLLGRDTAWRLGIVRWARQITPERATRISDALARCDVFDAGTLDGRLYWEDGRPLLFLRELTLLTVKLVHEAWLHDPRTTVVFRGRPVGHNPFADFPVTYVEDAHGLVAGLLGIDADPMLVEPRFGSVTYTAGTGWMDLANIESMRVHPFYKTLAEAAFLAKVGEDFENTMIQSLSRLSLRRLEDSKKNFEALCRAALLQERPIRDPVLLERLRQNREALAALRDHVRDLLETASRRAVHARRCTRYWDVGRESRR